jgi:hypothetical protein
MTNTEKIEIAKIKAKYILSVRKDIRNIKNVPVELLVDKAFMNELIKATENYCLSYLDFLKKQTRPEMVASLYQRRQAEAVKLVMNMKKSRKEFMINKGSYKTPTTIEGFAKVTKNKFHALRED